MGTWQFGGGQFAPIEPRTITGLIELALNIGILNFDTASVYGDGKVEALLGGVLPVQANVVTKIPAKIKPRDPMITIGECYDRGWMQQSLELSLTRLRVAKLDTVLLHNWSASWTDPEEILLTLQGFKETGLVNRVGISLPDGFGRTLQEKVCQLIDVVQAPYNAENNWVTQSLEQYKKYNLQVMLRSLFLQGRSFVGSNSEQAGKILQRALHLQTGIVVGMVTKQQIVENCNDIMEFQQGSR